ncbi:unnamed protein product [Lactuca saligna]|uniref:Polyphenol oxidase C-terminal domain-containing protein n=1 Tax=Lactuca saligna TaxID=75948 RepID=A0AA36A600_LACSI|nr:unnamed protein product [Lactuca saligna]
MMTSFTLYTVPAATTATTNIIKTNCYQLKTHAKQTHRLKASCNAIPDENNDKTLETSLQMKNIDRRNIILQLGGLFVASNMTSVPLAYADAISARSNHSVCAASPLGIQNLGTPVKEHMENREDVDTNKLGYQYKRSEIPWGRSQPTEYRKDSKFGDKSIGIEKKVWEVEFPVKLNKTVKVLVKRPAVNRTKEDKQKANEILLVNGVRFDGEKYVKFDVFVNDIDNGTETTPADSEFAGSFAQLPHGKTDRMMMMSGVRFGLTELLEDIKAEDDEYVLVKLVPRTGCDDVTVSEIKIELVPVV